MIQGYAIPNATILGNNGAYKSEFYKALEGAKAAGATVEEAPCLLARGVEAYNDGLPSTPSLLIVPQFYKAGNLYQDVPPFVAEDTTMRFTVSRNTTATRVNSSGLIESVASGVPRIDWLGQSCPGLLVEASGQNLAFHSESWVSGNNWQLSDGSGRVTVVSAASGTLAPNGTSTANAITPTSGNITHYLYSNASGSITYVSGTVYTISAFFKKGAGDSGRYVQVASVGSRFIGNPYANFDLELGTALTVSGSTSDSNRTSRIQDFGNGWYRCSLTATCNNSGSSSVGVLAALLTADTNARLGAAFAGNTNDYIFGWGAQLETGSIATTYIPTTVAAVSRAADVISASGALVSGLIGQTAGTIYCEFTFLGTPASRSGPIYLRQGSLRGMGINFAPTDSPSGIRFSSRNNAGTTNINIVSGALQIGTFYKVAIAYDAAGTAAGGTQASGVVAYVNGVQTNIGTLQVPDSAGLTEIRMYGANSGDDNEAFNGRIRAAALYTTRLSNDQLAELTRL